MLDDVLLVLWVFIPAGVANMAPIFAAHLPWTPLRKFTVPLDFGRSWRGRRILGANKTWRGLLAGIVMATLVLALQQWLVAHNSWLAGIVRPLPQAYPTIPALLAGPLFAIGALGGDALESLVKRQTGRAPGSAWVPFDQLDYIVGGALAVLPFIQLSLRQYILLGMVWFGLHLFASWTGYQLRLKQSPV